MGWFDVVTSVTQEVFKPSNNINGPESMIDPCSSPSQHSTDYCGGYMDGMCESFCAASGDPDAQASIDGATAADLSGCCDCSAPTGHKGDDCLGADGGDGGK